MWEGSSRDRRLPPIPIEAGSGATSWKYLTIPPVDSWRVFDTGDSSLQKRGYAMHALIKRFDSPDETRTFEKGKFDVIKIGHMTIGRASYEPGWKWSEHVGAVTGATSCEVDHIGLVLSGHAKALMNDGRELDLTPGDFFSIGPGHDSWVVGDEPYVSLHFMGADSYAQ